MREWKKGRVGERKEGREGERKELKEWGSEGESDGERESGEGGRERGRERERDCEIVKTCKNFVKIMLHHSLSYFLSLIFKYRAQSNVEFISYSTFIVS